MFLIVSVINVYCFNGGFISNIKKLIKECIIILIIDVIDFYNNVNYLTIFLHS